jgi:hypothetical protein
MMRWNFAIAFQSILKDNIVYPVKQNGNMPVEPEQPHHSTLERRLQRIWLTMMVEVLMVKDPKEFIEKKQQQ